MTSMSKKDQQTIMDTTICELDQWNGEECNYDACIAFRSGDGNVYKFCNIHGGQLIAMNRSAELEFVAIDIDILNGRKPKTYQTPKLYSQPNGEQEDNTAADLISKAAAHAGSCRGAYDLEDALTELARDMER